MRTTVSIQATVKSGEYEALEIFLKDNLANVRGFEGALNVSILFNQETNDFLIYEEWLSVDHHQAYMKSITDNGVLQQLASFFAGPPSVKYYEMQDI